MPDGLRSSGLLRRLESDIAKASSAAEADGLRAERAAYLARMGRLDDARRDVAELQERNRGTPQLVTSVRLHLAEGLIDYYANLGASQTDSLQRALALSGAGAPPALRALCAAWMAQAAYARLDLRDVARHARDALQLAGPDDHAARSRASLVVAQGLHFGARPDLAKPWYAQARLCAVAEGDDATVGAVMHNMGWLRMLSLRHATLTGRGDADDGRLAMPSASATDQHDGLTGNTSWDELRPLLRAQIVSLQGDAAQALKLYDAYVASSRSRGTLRAHWLADKAWCHWRVGQQREGWQAGELAAQTVAAELEVDDRAAGHARLAQLFTAAGDAARGRDHAAAAAQEWQLHAQLQAQAVELLSALPQDGLAR